MFGKPGSILLCISDLPAGVSRKDLKSFVQHAIDAVREGAVRVTPAISDYSILRLTNPATGAVSYEGLVAVQPARLALEIIEQLRSTPLRGKRLQVHRYRHSTFDVENAAQTRSISDLLRVPGEEPDAEAPRFRLELVAKTANPTPASGAAGKDVARGAAHAPEPRPRGVFA